MSSSLTKATTKRALSTNATPATATPKTPVMTLPAAPTPPPGQWTHPRLEEIAQRQAASTFSTGNLQTILCALLLVLLTFAAPRLWPNWAMPALPFSIDTPTSIILLSLRTFGLTQIVISLLPLIRKPDDVTDIPLTPRQRSLLNLPPSPHPATPDAQFITPPRYSRSTPRTDSAGDRQIGSTGSSRAATVGSPLDRSVSGSSLGGPSPLTAAGGVPLLGVNGSPFAHTPSPGSGSPLARKMIKGRTASVTLTNKWLYQKRMASPSGFM